jgi:16S rRNA (guanine966-N2)-methyltransferase
MRITAGTAKGTHLRGPSRGDVRPTSERVKDALFNSLAPRLPGARVLDLFAGTGALGIEALSRGAVRVVFVERDARAAAAIRANLAAARLQDAAQVRRGAADTELRALEREGAEFDLIILDPPYGRDLPGRTLRRLAGSPLLAPGGLIAAEGHWRDDPGDVTGLRRIRTARYGETAVWFYAGDGGGEAAEERPEVPRETGAEGEQA